jgi:hypothetical protein
MVAFATLSFLPLIALLRSDAAAGRRWRPMLLYGLCCTLAIYCGFEIVLVTCAQLTLLLAHRKRAWAVFVSLAGVAILAVPVAVLALRRGSGQLYWVGDGRVDLLDGLWRPVSEGLLGTVPGSAVVGQVLAGLLAVGLLARLLARMGGDRGLGMAVIVAWLLVPLIICAVASLAGEPIELGRYALMVCPALALGLAVLLGGLPRPAAAGLLVVLVGLHTVAIADALDGQPPLNTVTGTVRAIVRQSSPGRSCIIFYQQDQRQHFDYWLTRAPSQLAAAQRTLRPLLPSAPWSEVRSYVEDDRVLSRTQLSADVAGCSRTFFWYGYGGDMRVAAVRARARRGHRFEALVASFYRRHRPLTAGSTITVYSQPRP